MIDFSSIRKVIIFSAIATDDQVFFTPKRCKLHDDSFPLYCATQGGGYGKPTAHAHVMMFDPTSRSNAMPSKKTMELLEDVCRSKNCSKARPHVSR